MSGTRVIDFGKRSAGLGHDLSPELHADLISRTGKIDLAQVRSAIGSLNIDAAEEDFASIGADLQTMRITQHRKTAALDKTLGGMEQLRADLPAAIRELRQSRNQSSLNAAFTLAAFDKALMKLMRAVDTAQQAAVWGSTKQTWHDDAMWLAMHLQRIATRTGRTSALRFTSSMGPTTSCLVRLLIVAGIEKTESSVAKGLREHPQAHLLGLT